MLHICDKTNLCFQHYQTALHNADICWVTLLFAPDVHRSLVETTTFQSCGFLFLFYCYATYLHGEARETDRFLWYMDVTFSGGVHVLLVSITNSV